MSEAVDFDRECCFVAEKVQNVRPNRMLPPELESFGTALQHIPEPPFWWSHLPAQ